jgi:uncharacterized protein YukE
MAAEDEVYVGDTKLLTTMAGKFDDWEQKLRDGLVGVAAVTVTPGDFPAANQLKTTVEERAKQLDKAMGALADRLKGIANNLRDSAKQYDKNNDENVDAAKNIDWDLDD